MNEETYFSEILSSHPCFPNNLTKFPRSIASETRGGGGGEETSGGEENGLVCSATTNLCDLKFKISPPSGFGGGLKGGSAGREIHGSLNWFGCIDINQCPSISALKEEVIAKFCSIPSCTIFEANTSLRQLCILSQTLGCSLRNRMELSDDFEVSALCAVDSADDTDQSDVISAPDSSLLQELQEHKLIVSSDMMNSLIDCGVGYVYDIPSLTYSGFANSLGSFKPCINHHTALIKNDDTKAATPDAETRVSKDEVSLKNQAAYKYCITTFDTMAHGGTCLAHTCDGRKYSNMLAFLCDSLDSVQKDNYFRGSETCLDYLDMVPLNSCLMVQMLGCNNTLAATSGGNFDVMSLFISTNAEGSYDQSASSRSHPDPRLRMLYDWTELNPTFNTHSWETILSELKRIERYVKEHVDSNAPHRSLLTTHQSLHQQSPALQTPTIDWFSSASSSEDTIKNYRYESPQIHKMYLRCGGWFDSLDDSRFNKTAGWLTAAAILLLPFYPLRIKRVRGLTDWLSQVVSAWPKNIKRNLAMNIDRAYKLGHGEFAHICGLRSLNMAWVVLGHTFTFSWQEGVDRNFQKTLQLIHDYKFQIILSGQLAVDSFFFIAGLMFGLFSAARIESLCREIVYEDFFTRSIAAIGFSLRQCIRRYLRLMTTTAFVLAISYWIIPYLWTGPMWVSYIDYVRYGQLPTRDAGCYTHWWKVILMISNLDAGGLSCMGHTWYLANDFQFYILSNIIVMITTLIAFRSRLRGGGSKCAPGEKIVSGGGVGKSSTSEKPFSPPPPTADDIPTLTTPSRLPLYLAILAIFILTSAYSYKVVIDEQLHFSIPAFSDASITPSVNEGSKDLLTNWVEFYVKPWCRIGPYLIGLVTGILYRDRQFEKFITTKPFSRGIGDFGGVPKKQVLIDDSSPLIRKAIDENGVGAAGESPLMRRREAPETPRPSHPYQDLNDENLTNNTGGGGVGGSEGCRERRPNIQVIYAYTAVSLVLGYLCVISFPYKANKGNLLAWNLTVDRLWFVFNRSVWALCCGWLSLILAYVPIFPRQLNLMKPLRAFLSSKLMALCSIFTFTFYLVHPFVQQIYYASRTSDIGLSNLIGWFATIAHFVVTIFFGVLLCIVVEIPLEYLCRSIGF